MGEFNSQGLTNTAWAFATAGVKAPKLFDAIATEAPAQFSEFSSQELVNTAWAFATAGAWTLELFEAIDAAALWRLGEFKSQELVTVAWAFAKACFKAPVLFDAIAAEALPRLDEFNSQNLANVAWAFAKAGVTAPELFEAIAATALPRFDEFNPQGVANTAWAFACFGRLSPDQIAVVLDRVGRDMSSFEDIDLSQLYQFWLVARLEYPDLRPLDPRHEERLRQAYMRVVSKPSRLQVDISAALRQLGWAHEVEYVTDEGLLLDLAQPSSKYCVEVDGPFHYLRESGTGRLVQNGATSLKTRLLERLGWTVARVPFYEWSRLVSDNDRRRYLQSHLSVSAESAFPPTRAPTS